MIDRIGSVDPLLPEKKARKAENINKKADLDSISLSSDAIKKAEIYKAMETVAAVPDISQERIQELRDKINDPAYIDEIVLSKTAENIMAAFGL